MNSIWAYSRRVHLILLLVLLVLYVASWSTTYAFYTVVPFGGLYWAIAALGFVFLWLLRGLLALTSVFPAFHYGTLFVEWLAHLVKFSYQLYALVVVLSGGIAAFEGHGAAFVIVTLLIVLLVDITYFLLLFKLTPVLTALMFGTESDREALAKEARGDSSMEHEPLTP